MKDQRKSQVSSQVAKQVMESMINSHILMGTNDANVEFDKELYDKMFGILQEYKKTSKIQEKLCEDMTHTAIETIVSSPSTPVKTKNEIPQGLDIELQREIIQILRQNSKGRLPSSCCNGNTFQIKFPKLF